MTTLEIQHRMPVTVDTFEVQLPYFFQTGKYMKIHYCMTEEMRLITCYKADDWTVYTRKFDNANQAADELKKLIDHESFELSNEEVFHDAFTKAHRDLYYSLNHHLRPNEEQ